MFERYTQKARRAIFFARYEASQFGSPYIEMEAQHFSHYVRVKLAHMVQGRNSGGTARRTHSVHGILLVCRLPPYVTAQLDPLVRGRVRGALQGTL
jgi:hypothetical protein